MWGPLGVAGWPMRSGLVVAREHEVEVLKHLRMQHRAFIIGKLLENSSGRSPEVVLLNKAGMFGVKEETASMPPSSQERSPTANRLKNAEEAAKLQPVEPPKRKRVGILISGTGTNMRALLEHAGAIQSSDGVVPNQRLSEDEQNSVKFDSAAEIVLVISNKASAPGLSIAGDAGIETAVVSHRDFATRDDFDAAVNAHLQRAGVDFICLAGFMRILGAPFVNTWKGRILNVHPSLLPSFKGAHAHRDALAAGVRVSGCTVHFVVPEVDAGPILVQKTVEVNREDTEESLAEKVKRVEHLAYPEALEMLCRGKVGMNETGEVEWNKEIWSPVFEWSRQNPSARIVMQ